MIKKILAGMLIWSLSVLPAPLYFAQAQRADYSCADGAVKDWYSSGIKIKVLSGCVRASGTAENIRSARAIVYFDLVPDAASRRLLNAHNAYFGGVITVYVYGRGRIHGRLRNGVRVNVTASWVHDLTNGSNDLPAAHAVDVLPQAATDP
jgi:hypothetical protein